MCTKILFLFPHSNGRSRARTFRVYTPINFSSFVVVAHLPAELRICLIPDPDVRGERGFSVDFSYSRSGKPIVRLSRIMGVDAWLPRRRRLRVPLDLPLFRPPSLVYVDRRPHPPFPPTSPSPRRYPSRARRIHHSLLARESLFIYLNPRATGRPRSAPRVLGVSDGI